MYICSRYDNYHNYSTMKDQLTIEFDGEIIENSC